MGSRFQDSLRKEVIHGYNFLLEEKRKSAEFFAVKN